MNQIVVEKTSLGDPVLSVNGRQTCSFVDPIKEAEAWLDHYRDLIVGRRALVVLGLGSGHHVARLIAKHPQTIFVVEHREEIVGHFLSHFPRCVSRVQFFSTEAAALKRMVCCLETPFSVLTFAPAVMNAHQEYQKIYQWLSGRDPESLRSQFQLRGVDHFFCPKEVAESTPAQSYRLLARQEALPSKWRNLFKIMGEWIK